MTNEVLEPPSHISSRHLRFDGAPDLEFRAATRALELENSALSYQRVRPAIAFRTATRTRRKRRCMWSCAGAVA